MAPQPVFVVVTHGGGGEGGSREYVTSTHACSARGRLVSAGLLWSERS